MPENGDIEPAYTLSQIREAALEALGPLSIRPLVRVLGEKFNLPEPKALVLTPEESTEPWRSQ